MPSGTSVFATFAPTVRPVDVHVLYSANLHVKALLKQLVAVVLAALVPVLLIVVYALLGSLNTNVSVPGFKATQLPSLPPLNPFIVIPILFIWYVGCAIAVYRSYYEWQHTVIELTRTELAVLRPRNVLLLLRRQERDSIRAASIVGFQTEKPSVSEFLIFHDCITASVMISEIEGKKRSPVDQMQDIRDYKELDSAINALQVPRPFAAGG